MGGFRLPCFQRMLTEATAGARSLVETEGLPYVKPVAGMLLLLLPLLRLPLRRAALRRSA